MRLRDYIEEVDRLRVVIKDLEVALRKLRSESGEDWKIGIEKDTRPSVKILCREYYDRDDELTALCNIELYEDGKEKLITPKRIKKYKKREAEEAWEDEVNV